MAHRALVAAALLVALGALRAQGAGEPLEAHTERPRQTVVVDAERLYPTTLRISPGDALVFENHTVRPITVSVAGPDDLAERVRCGLIRRRATDPEQAPWLLFTWNDRRLSATIPPGRLASICSLQRGRYDFLAAHVGPPGEPLGTAQIVVE